MTVEVSFALVEVAAGVPSDPAGILRLSLTRQNWDDYGYRTSFDLWWAGHETPVHLGAVKIARLGMDASFGVRTAQTPLDEQFRSLGSEYFSLGQDATYYENLIAHLGRDGAQAALSALRDLTLEPDRMTELESERVFRRSVMRVVKWDTVTDQYQRIVVGGLRRENYSLRYIHEPLRPDVSASTVFEVNPSQSVPGTLQVVIGSNGAGKTRMLRNIVVSLSSRGPISDGHTELSGGKRLRGLVTVSFSAFDIFPSLPGPDVSSSGLQMKQLGLNLLRRIPGESEHQERDQAEVFEELVDDCESSGRSERLLRAVETLSGADPLLREYDLTDVEAMRALPYAELSSGHKIVLLTMAGLVRDCDDGTLILLDEPESHLHPPLLAAFVRALADLVAETNSLAIVATHSPVVVQQVPRRHARKMWRRGPLTRILPMNIETFGENLGYLSREVFGVELEQAGHFDLIKRAASLGTYELALAHLGGSLGEEAKAILRALLAEGTERA